MSYEGGTRSANKGCRWCRKRLSTSLGSVSGHAVEPQYPPKPEKNTCQSLVEFQSDRPWHLEQFDGTDWEVTAFAISNDDPNSADPAVAVNTTYGGIIAAYVAKSTTGVGG